MGEPRPLWTTAEAAEMLGISHSAVRNAIARRTLEAVHISPRLNMVTLEAIAAYRREHRGKGSWASRDPAKPPTQGALYARAYRKRKKAKPAEAMVEHAVTSNDHSLPAGTA